MKIHVMITMLAFLTINNQIKANDLLKSDLFKSENLFDFAKKVAQKAWSSYSSPSPSYGSSSSTEEALDQELAAIFDENDGVAENTWRENSSRTPSSAVEVINEEVVPILDKNIRDLDRESDTVQANIKKLALLEFKLRLLMRYYSPASAQLDRLRGEIKVLLPKAKQMSFPKIPIGGLPELVRPVAPSTLRMDNPPTTMTLSAPEGQEGTYYAARPKVSVDYEQYKLPPVSAGAYSKNKNVSSSRLSLGMMPDRITLGDLSSTSSGQLPVVIPEDTEAGASQQGEGLATEGNTSWWGQIFGQ